MRGLRTRRAGCPVYVPSTLQRTERAARDQRIAADFNGRNIAELMSAHRVSRAHVYRAVRRIKGSAGPCKKQP